MVKEECAPVGQENLVLHGRFRRAPLPLVVGFMVCDAILVLFGLFVVKGKLDPTRIKRLLLMLVVEFRGGG
jgi:hypothetical protein